MLLTVKSIPTDEDFELNAPDDWDLDLLKIMCESKCGLSAEDMSVQHKGKIITDQEDLVLQDGDTITISKLDKALEEAQKLLQKVEISKIVIPEKPVISAEVEENLCLAMEHHPELFGKVLMLYVDCKVNEHKFKALVDSGAQQSFISQNAAEKCGLLRLVDKRYSGIAKGVGTAKIIGCIRMAHIQLGQALLSTSFWIMDFDFDIDVLIGLNMLKKHRCYIDLRKNVLHIGSTGDDVRFLSEHELPKKTFGKENKKH